jgi:cytoskeletal protein CcmA (bactofilin family)
MALWNQPAQESYGDKVQPVSPAPTPTPVNGSVATAPIAPVALVQRESVAKDRNESVFGAGVSIDGKIEGDANVRIAGKFKGEILIKGDLSVEKGADVNAKVNATNITVAGEVTGNIVASAHVKVVESGQVVGDLKAATMTVASGARMRGHVEFGWSASEAAKFSGDKKGDGEKFEMAER